MLFHKSVLTLLAVCLSTTACLGEEPSFPQAVKGVEYLKDQYIVQYKGTDSFEEAKRSMSRERNEEVNLVRNIDSRNIGVYKFSDKKAAAKWRESTAGIKYFERDSIVYLDRLSSSSQDSVPRKLAETTPYGIGHVKAEAVPDDDASTRKVCVVDDGYDMGHEDLPFDDTNTQITGESFVSGYPSPYTDIGSHGTHVTGTIAAIGGNNKGVKGVLRDGNIKLHIARVFPPSGGTSTSTVIAGFESCGQNGANVINMSLGGGGFTQSFADAIADSYAAGIVTFASSGNSYGTGYNYPASYPFVLSVGSITESYVRSSFSTYNDEVDLCAPGSSVLSTTPGDNYAFYSGTSMASPHAAGVAALVWSLYPDLNHEALINILETTATDLPLGAPDGYDNEYGHGLVDAEAAAEAVLSSAVPTVSPAPSLSSAPSNTPSVSIAPSSTPSEFCPTGLKAKVEILTDNWPGETSWDIKDADDVVVASRNSYTSPATPYEDKVCLPETAACSGTDYTFTINDTYGDGICCAWGAGSYTVSIEDEIYAEGGDFGYSESKSLCFLPGTEPSGTPTVSVQPSIVPSQAPSNTPSVSISPSSTPSSTPSNTPSVSISPSSTPSEFCPAGLKAKVEVFTDYYPGETSWDIKDADDVVVASRNSYTSPDTPYEDKVCLPETAACSGTDYTFTINDTYGDGICCSYGIGSYTVSIEDEIYVEGGEFFFSESTSLCYPSCSSNGSESECDEMETSSCYWDTKRGQCRECSSLSDFRKPQATRIIKRRCNFYGCSWNRNGNFCE